MQRVSNTKFEIILSCVLQRHLNQRIYWTKSTKTYLASIHLSVWYWWQENLKTNLLFVFKKLRWTVLLTVVIAPQLNLQPLNQGLIQFWPEWVFAIFGNYLALLQEWFKCKCHKSSTQTRATVLGADFIPWKDPVSIEDFCTLHFFSFIPLPFMFIGMCGRLMVFPNQT